MRQPFLRSPHRCVGLRSTVACVMIFAALLSPPTTVLAQPTGAADKDSSRDTQSTRVSEPRLSTPGAVARDARALARRVGLWAAVGGGRGSAGLQCDACNSASQPAFLGHVAAGGTAHERFHVGVELWTYLDVIGNGIDRTASGTQLVARFYVQDARKLYLVGGVGTSRFSIDDGRTRFGVAAPALSLGAGWDIPVRGVVLSPALSLVASSGGTLTSSSTGNAVAPNARLGLWRSTVAITWF